MHTKLLLDLQFQLQKKHNLRNLFQWIGVQLCLELSMVVLTCLTQDAVLQIYWILYTMPLFLSVMRYQQFISYVNLLYIRFRALNECIEQLKFIEFSHFQNVNNTKDIKTFLIVNQLKDVQKIHRILTEANRMLCKLFHWSMLLNVSNDSLNLLFNMYWLIVKFIENSSKIELIGVSSWTVFNVILLSSLANACQSVYDEVI